MELDLNRLILGNCLDVLKTFPDNFFDSCVSDVPYGLGTKEPTPEEIIAYIQGEELDTGGDFMGKKWSVPSVNIWKEVYRVLKPGGHVLAFAGTRTWDLISMGLRAAGFVNRDTIAEDHPALQWIYGSGMPKSSNVEKAVIKKGSKKVKEVELEEEDSEEEPQTLGLEAAEWAGWGTGLKPSWEPILVFRKPFKGSLTNNVLDRGVGALNIDATRVKHSNAKDFEDHKKQVDAIRAKGGVRGDSWKNTSDLSGANEVKTGGRWPANMVLTHHPECRLVGTKNVKGSAPTAAGFDRFNQNLQEQGYRPGAYKKGPPKLPPSRVDDNGKEQIAAWQCHECCPIAALNAQSGNRPSTLTGRADPNQSHSHPGTEFNSNSTFLGERTHHSNVYADDGGASRFFQQFQSELQEPFFYIPKANRKEASMGEFKVKHPTLKPVKLMQYLVRLVTPKGGIVLDPYCGSGSTCHATLLEDCYYIGIEKDPENFEEAERRMAVVTEYIEQEKHSISLFNEAMSMEWEE